MHLDFQKGNNMFKKLIVSTALSTALILSIPAFGAEAGSDIIIAKINGEPIRKVDLDKIEKSIPPEALKKAKEENKDKLFSSLRDQAIDFKLLSEAAKKANLDKDPEVVTTLNQLKEQVLLQAYIGKQLNPLVNDAALKTAYAEFLKEFPKDETEVKIRHIMFNDEASALKTVDALKGGTDFQKLAREQSIDKSTASQGGDLGYIRAGQVDKAFADAAFALKAGEFSKTPVKSAMGWHVLKLDDRRKLKAPTFEEIKDQLGSLVFQKQMKKLIEQLRDKASIERFDANGKAIAVGSDTASKDPAATDQTLSKASTEGLDANKKDITPPVGTNNKKIAAPAA